MLNAISLRTVPDSDTGLREALYGADLPTNDIKDEGSAVSRGASDGRICRYRVLRQRYPFAVCFVLPTHRGHGPCRLIAQAPLRGFNGNGGIYLATTTAAPFFSIIMKLNRTATWQRNKTMTDKIYKVLFLCTGNSARSILGESILNHEGKGRFRAYSAGGHPKGQVTPHAIRELEALGYPSTGFSPKSRDIFAEPGAPQMDFIFTVCDSAAGEACPLWPGHPITAHWGIEDPAAVMGTEIEIRRAFAQAARFLKNRIGAFLNLPLSSIDKLALEQTLRQIGQMEGSTSSQEKSV